MSSGVRAPRGALGRIIRSSSPGCSSVWTEHPVRDRGVGGSSPFNQTSGDWHRSIREWSSGTDARLWTERRWFESIFPSTGEARSMPRRAAVAQSGERRPVKAEATGSKPVCGAKPWW